MVWSKRNRKRKVLISGVDILEKIENSETKDNEVVKTVKEMKKTEVIVLRDKNREKKIE